MTSKKFLDLTGLAYFKNKVQAEIDEKPTLPTTVNDRFLHTNATTGALEWSEGGGTATWGGITGTLSNQTDLQNALNAKQATATLDTDVGTLGYTKNAIKEITMNGASVTVTGGVAALGTVITAHQDITGKQDKLPTYVNDRFLHVDSSGNLEWAVAGSGTGTVKKVKVNSTEHSPDADGTVDIGTFLTTHQDITGKQDVSTLETDVAAKGFTKNAGTITGIKMNGASVGTSGEVDLGTVITAHQDISGKLDKPTTALTPASKCKITYDANGLVTAGADLDATDIPALGISKITNLQTLLDGKVAKNSDITAGTHTKITYDAKGLVTAGADLEASDIPTIEQTQVNGLGTALGAKQDTSSLETDVASKGFTKNVGTVTGITMNGASKGTSGVVDLGDVITDVSGKLDVLGKEAGSQEPYKLPYFFSKEADASKITVTARTITMDNAKSLGTYTMDIPSATTATAGLMASADKSALDAILIKDASVSSGTLTITKKDGTPVTFTKTAVADSLVSTSVTEALSANKGKELNDRIDNVSSMGRFLSVWNCATGVPVDKPGTIPYTYKSGDYYIVGSITTGTNYRPKGAQFTDVVSQDSEAEPDSVHVNDIYRYTTSGWVLQSQEEKEVTFSSVTGNPRDNSLLATELDKAVPKLGTEPGSGEQYHFPYNFNSIVQNADNISTTFDTVTLDGNKTKVSYNLAIPSADITNNKAGLYTKALADAKADASALNTEITNRTTAVTNEANARSAKDTELETAIGTEKTRAETAEGALTTKVNALKVKDASVSGNTLTLTRPDDTTLTFSPTPSAYIKSADVSTVNTLKLKDQSDTDVTFTVDLSKVIDDTSTASAVKTYSVTKIRSLTADKDVEVDLEMDGSTFVISGTVPSEGLDRLKNGQGSMIANISIDGTVAGHTRVNLMCIDMGGATPFFNGAALFCYSTDEMGIPVYQPIDVTIDATTGEVTGGATFFSPNAMAFNYEKSYENGTVGDGLKTAVGHVHSSDVHVTVEKKNQWDAKSTVEGKTAKVSGASEIKAINIDGTDYNLPETGLTAVTWGSITGTLSSQTDLNTALNAKAAATDLSDHTSDSDVHVSTSEKATWNAKADSATLSSHTTDSNIHVGTTDRTAWNGAATHVSDTTVHITAAERTAWNAMVPKTDIVNALTQTTAGKVLDAAQGKALNDLIVALAARVTTLESSLSTLETTVNTIKSNYVKAE